MNCLYCGAPLSPDTVQRGWHRRCARAFFGEDVVPEITISNETLEELAGQSVSVGRTVAGVQRKLSVHLSREGGVSRLTLVGYPAGYILKPPAREYPELPELEHLVMSMASRAGITTVPHGLITMADGDLAYITRRVDRRPSTPYTVPMEDLCQLSGRLTEDKYRGSYEKIGSVVRQYSSRPGVDLSELFLVVVFSFAAGNADMHLKNFSLYRPGREWFLAPAYDLVATDLVIPDDPEESALTVNGKKRRLLRTDFVAFGTTIGINPKAVERLIGAIVDRHPEFRDLITNSFLTSETADRFATLLDQRIARLQG